MSEKWTFDDWTATEDGIRALKLLDADLLAARISPADAHGLLSTLMGAVWYCGYA